MDQITKTDGEIEVDVYITHLIKKKKNLDWLVERN